MILRTVLAVGLGKGLTTYSIYRKRIREFLWSMTPARIRFYLLIKQGVQIFSKIKRGDFGKISPRRGFTYGLYRGESYKKFKAENYLPKEVRKALLSLLRACQGKLYWQDHLRTDHDLRQGVNVFVSLHHLWYDWYENNKTPNQYIDVSSWPEVKENLRNGGLGAQLESQLHFELFYLKEPIDPRMKVILADDLKRDIDRFQKLASALNISCDLREKYSPLIQQIKGELAH